MTITNFKKEIDIVYKGELAVELKEGENTIFNAYLPNKNNKSKIVAYSYMTNHSLELENWEGTSGKLRNQEFLIN